MQKELKIIMVDDDEELCRQFAGCFEETDGLELVASTGSVSRALEYLTEYEPDVVILDLELHKGSGNGMMFLTELNARTDVKRPYVLINTNNCSRVTYDIVSNIGADFVMYKHQDGYCPQEVANFLLAVLSGRNGEKKTDPKKTVQDNGTQSGVRSRILAELNCVAVNPSSKGYLYLADAIEILCGGQVGNVSGIIAERYGKSKPSVERAMQNAIDRAWGKADIDDLIKHYTAYISPKRQSPTVTEFISFYAAKLKC